MSLPLIESKANAPLLRARTRVLCSSCKFNRIFLGLPWLRIYRNTSRTKTLSVSALTTSKLFVSLHQPTVFICSASFAFPLCLTLQAHLIFTSVSSLAVVMSLPSSIAFTPRSARIQVAERPTEQFSTRMTSLSGLIPD